MTKLIEIPHFYLDSGINFSKCLPSERCPSGIENISTTEAGYVDLVIQLDAANKPVKANAYQPDIGACSRDAEVSGACRGIFQFEGKPLADLIKNSVVTQHEPNELQSLRMGEVQGVPQVRLHQERLHYTAFRPQNLISGFNPYYAIGLIAASCVAVTIVIMLRRLRKRDATLKSIVRAGSQKQNTIMPLRASSIQAQASDLTARSLSGNNRSATGLVQPDTDQKIEEILSRLDSLEQQMVSDLMKTSIKSEQMDESG
jgi:hypothetical protein